MRILKRALALAFVVWLVHAIFSGINTLLAVPGPIQPVVDGMIVLAVLHFVFSSRRHHRHSRRH